MCFNGQPCPFSGKYSLEALPLYQAATNTEPTEASVFTFFVKFAEKMPQTAFLQSSAAIYFLFNFRFLPVFSPESVRPSCTPTGIRPQTGLALP